MKTNNLLTLIFCISFAVGLSGCLSSGLPAPKSDSDTLVVVPVVIIDGRTTPFKGEIKYKVFMDNIATGKKETFILSTNSHGYFYLKRIPAGKYSLTKYATEGLVNDKEYDIDINKYLVVEEGELTIFPGKLTVYIYNKDMSQDSSYLYFWIRKIDDDQISRIEDFLKTDENYGLWQ